MCEYCIIDLTKVVGYFVSAHLYTRPNIDAVILPIRWSYHKHVLDWLLVAFSRNNASSSVTFNWMPLTALANSSSVIFLYFKSYKVVNSLGIFSSTSLDTQGVLENPGTTVNIAAEGYALCKDWNNKSWLIVGATSNDSNEDADAVGLHRVLELDCMRLGRSNLILETGAGWT